MKTKDDKTVKLFESNYTNIKRLKRAEKLAWFFFVSIGLAYIALSFIIQIG